MNADIFTQSVALGNINPIGVLSPKLGGNIDPRNVLNHLRVSIPPAALTVYTSRRAKLVKNKLSLSTFAKKRKTRSINCETETA